MQPPRFGAQEGDNKMMDADLVIRSDRTSTQIKVGGFVSAATARVFCRVLTQEVRTLAAGVSPIELDFGELELNDGQAVAETVNALRDLSDEQPIVIANAPQMLAHTLYKIGMLTSERLKLITPQVDVGSSS